MNRGGDGAGAGTVDTWIAFSGLLSVEWYKGAHGRDGSGRIQDFS